MKIKYREDLNCGLTGNKNLQRVIALLHCLRQNLEKMTVNSTISAFIEALTAFSGSMISAVSWV
jgi:hypothetical protein